MDVNQSHPVKAAFCELLNKSMKKEQHTALNRKARNKWFLAYTLLKNPALKKQRKNYVAAMSKFRKVESFEQFLERRVKFFFGNSHDKKQSKSTPNLLDQNNNRSHVQIIQNLNEILAYEKKTSTVNFRNETSLQMAAQEKRQIYAKSEENTFSDYEGPLYENEQFHQDFLNTSDSTNDTVLNYTTEYNNQSLEK